MSGRVFVWLLAAVLLTSAPPAQAQQPARIPPIGYISGPFNPANPGPYVEALRQGLRELGYAEGKNFFIEYRGAEGKFETIPAIVAELVPLKVDVLVLPLIAANRGRQEGNHNNPHRDDYPSGSGGGWLSCQLGAPRW